MSDKPIILQARGYARPAGALRSQLRILYGPETTHRLDKVMEDAEAIDALAGILKESIDARNTADQSGDLASVVATPQPGKLSGSAGVVRTFSTPPSARAILQPSVAHALMTPQTTLHITRVSGTTHVRVATVVRRTS